MVKMSAKQEDRSLDPQVLYNKLISGMQPWYPICNSSLKDGGSLHGARWLERLTVSQALGLTERHSLGEYVLESPRMLPSLDLGAQHAFAHLCVNNHSCTRA